MTTLPIPAPIYPPEYRSSAQTAFDTALSSVPAYRTWRRYDRGPSADIFERYQAMPVLTKADLREHEPAGFNLRRCHQCLVSRVVGRVGGLLVEAACGHRSGAIGRAP